MRIKTAELTGAALDWAVSQASLDGEEGFDYYICHKGRVMQESGDLSWRFHPSSNWDQGGPIIERERISTDWMHRMVWDARIYVPDEEPWQMDGETMLIAAMRCFVASKLGDEVEIPKELLP